jgi:hypothetical protein
MCCCPEFVSWALAAVAASASTSGIANLDI